MQTKILLKVNWKVSRCGIAEMKARVILLTWVNIPAWVNVILVKRDNQDSYFPHKVGPRMEPGEYKGNRILVYLCNAHRTLKCFRSYVLLLLGFQKGICQLQYFSLKWEGNRWVQKQKAQNVRVFGTHIQEMGRGGNLSFPSTWSKLWKIRPLRKIKGPI